MSRSQVAGERTNRADGYVNMLNKYGTTQDHATAYTYAPEGTVPDREITEHYETNGLFAKIIDAPAEEAVKHGFNLGLKTPDVQEYIEDMLDELEWEDKASFAIKMARLYGGALGVMFIDDGGGIDEPLNWRRIKSIDEIRIYERAVVQPDYSSLYNYDPRNPARSTTSRFGMPEYYHINSIYGQFWVHESRCLIFRNGVLPEQTMNPYYRFWGIPEYVRIKRELREAVTTHSLGVKLLERSVQAIYSMQGLAQLLSTEDGENEVIKRLQVIDMARGLFNSIAIDSEGENYDFKTATMTGVKEIVDATCNMLSAVTNIPQTMLFGRAPAGMNSTGESDLENYYNYIERHQKLMLRSNLRTLLDIIAQVGMRNGRLKEKPRLKPTFNPLWSMSESEKATVDQAKAQTAHLKAQTAQIYVDMTALDPSEVRKGLAQEDEFQVEELLDDIGDDDLWSGESDVPPTAAENPEQNRENHLTHDEQSASIKIKKPSQDGGFVCTDAKSECRAKDPAKCPVHGAKSSEALSATGANPSIPGMTEKNLDRHWGGKSDHSGQYPELTKEQYAQRALTLAQAEVGGNIDGYLAIKGQYKGSIVRYNKVTAEWVRAYGTGPATLFKPDQKESYFKRIKKYETEVGSEKVAEENTEEVSND